MTELNIPKLNINSEKYIFKKKLSLRRKSKRRLFYESAFMFILSILLVYINYLIPDKNLLLQNLTGNINESFGLIKDLFFNIYEVVLVVFIFISLFIALVLLLGSCYRIYKIMKRKTKQISYK